jgi:hypothetical protein
MARRADGMRRCDRRLSQRSDLEMTARSLSPGIGAKIYQVSQTPFSGETSIPTLPGFDPLAPEYLADPRAYSIPAEHRRIPESIITRNFINLDPPAHTVERRSAQKAFTRKLIADSEGLIRETANELIDGFASAGRCDLMQDFSFELSLRVTSR